MVSKKSMVLVSQSLLKYVKLLVSLIDSRILETVVTCIDFINGHLCRFPPGGGYLVYLSDGDVPFFQGIVFAHFF